MENLTMTKKIVHSCIVLCAAFLLYSHGVEAETLKAEAVLYKTKGAEVGKILFEEKENGVQINIKVNGLPPGIHALHIHDTGKCDPPDFKTAGGHFNPFGKEHGFLNPKGPHAGDLPNITIDKNGTVDTTMTTQLVTLKKGEPNSLLGEHGTSVVIHDMADDYISNPAGCSGARIACGIIKALK